MWTSGFLWSWPRTRPSWSDWRRWDTGDRRGNRFTRPVTDIPVRVEAAGGAPVPEAAIDILIRAYTSCARQNLRVGDHLTTTEIRGLADALGRPPVEVSLALTRLNGSSPTG